MFFAPADDSYFSAYWISAVPLTGVMTSRHAALVYMMTSSESELVLIECSVL